MPLLDLVHSVQSEKTGETLRGIQLDRFWCLRENARSDCALLTYIDSKVDRNSEDLGHQSLLEDEKVIKDRVVAKICLASVDGPSRHCKCPDRHLKA